MRALVFAGRRVVRHETVPDPGLEATTDALVRVTCAGICGSDLHPYHERERGLDHGTVMGHEFVGEVVEVGADVREIEIGELVCSPFTSSCGDCHYCEIGLTSRCVHGQLFGWVEEGDGLHGGQAEIVRVPLADSTLMPVSEGLSAEEALLLGDIFSTGFFCAELAGVVPGGVYAVVGCGPVGVLAALSAVHLGAGRVFALDSVPERLELAASVGAEPLDIRAEEPSAILLEATGGRGVDAAMEAVGSAGAERTAVDIVRPGGTVAVVGVHTDATFSFSPVEAYDKNLTYRVGRCPARTYMDLLAPVIVRENLPIQRVISHRLALSAGAEAYRMFDEKRDGCTKVVLSP